MPAPSLILARISAGGRDGKAACRELRKVIKDADGGVQKIADKLDMSKRSVLRLIKRADLVEYAIDVREKAGTRATHNGLYGA